MTTPKNILLIGATGAIGNHILRSVVGSKSHFQRIAILTSDNTLKTKPDLINSVKSQGVEIITGDVTKEADVKHAFKEIDTVISSVGRAVIAMQVSIVQWAAESGIKRFYPSEYGTDIAYSPKSKDEKPHQAKLKVRAALEQSGMEYTYVVVGPYPEMFMNSKLEDEYGVFDSRRKKAVLLGTGDEKISFTAMPDVGKLVVAALLHPEESRNKALKVNSYTATGHEILAEFEKQTGSKWDVQYTSLEKLKQLESVAWERQDPKAAAMTLRRIWAEGGTLYDKRDNDLIDAPPMDTLENQVKQVIEAQAAA